MSTLTFRDFAFTARHCLHGRSKEAASVHSHSYVVRLWFNKAHDQDKLIKRLRKWYGRLQDVRLDLFFEDSSDEGLAAYFLKDLASEGCVRVRVTTDDTRGAEASV